MQSSLTPLLNMSADWLADSACKVAAQPELTPLHHS